MDGKLKQSPDELLRRIRKQLGGKYEAVPIAIERTPTGWKAIADVNSELTRDRIEAAVERVREYHDLA